jgi:hypothetical protein
LPYLVPLAAGPLRYRHFCACNFATHDCPHRDVKPYPYAGLREGNAMPLTTAASAAFRNGGGR